VRGKDHLFQLIKSLSKTEKRYFTLDAQKSGRKESRYLELFRVINDQEDYDEQPLKALFGTKLGDDKARLYEAILRAMRDYQSKKSYKTRIKELLTDAKILFERKLYDQSENRLAEAKSLALDLQDHLAVLEINLNQRQLTREVIEKEFEHDVINLIEEKEKHLQLDEEEFWVHDTFDHLVIDILQNRQGLNEAAKTAFKQKYQLLLNLDDTSRKPFFTKRRLHQCRAFYYRLTGNTEQEFEAFNTALNLWKDYPKNKEEYYHLYLTDGINLLSASMKDEQKVKQFPELIAEIKSQKAPNPQGQKLLFERTTIYYLIFLLNSLDAEFESTIQEIQEGLQQYDISLSTKLSICLNVSFLLFLNDRYRDCLKWTAQITHLKKKAENIRKDIHLLNQVLILLTEYKLGDYEAIENANRRAARFFQRQPASGLKSLSVLIIGMIKQLQASANTKEEREILLKSKMDIQELGPNLGGGIDEICDLWIESEIQQSSIKALRIK